MRFLSWFSRLFWLTAACCALIYGAGLAGRSIPATLVAGRDRDSAVSPMDILLIDYSRGLSIVRRIVAPFAIRADWEANPPQVLMRQTGRDEVIFWLNRIDFRGMQLEPLVTHRVPADPRPRDLEATFAGQRAAVYSPATGEVALVEADSQANQRVRVTENSNEMVMAWSPDGSRVAVKDFRAAQLVLLDGVTISLFDTFRDAAPVWLPDYRSILLAQDTFVGRNGRILVLDAITGEKNPYTDHLVGRSPASCGTQQLGYVHIQPDRAVTVQTLDLTNGQTRTVLNAGQAEEQDVFSLAFAPRETCDWMLLEIRHPNAAESRFYRLHIPSGDLTHLGDNVRLLETGADAVIYESTTAGTVFTVRRAAFEVGAVPEIFGQIPAQNELVLWLEGYRRGLFLRSGQLWTLDLSMGTTPLLTVPARLQDLQLVPQE